MTHSLPAIRAESFKVACSSCNLRELCLPVGMSEEQLVRLDDVVGSRRALRRGEALFRVGETFNALVAVRTGFFKTCVTSEDGCDPVSGSQMADELLGLDGIGSDRHTCDAVTLYPFVRGRTASEVRLTETQWREFGYAMKALHTMHVPPELAARIPAETYSPEGRERVRAFLKTAVVTSFEDPVAAQLGAFFKSERESILDLVERAERHASVLRSRAPDFVTCHSDVHADNLLIDERGAVHIVDWDEPIFALTERDLMFIGGGQRFAGYVATEEHELFDRGYGDTTVDEVALTYHRYERIVQDIFVACKQLLLTQEGGANRALEFGYLPPNFLPNGTIDLARRADPGIQATRE